MKGSTAALLLISATGAGAAAPKPAGNAVARLLPVTDADADAIRNGCETWFTQGDTGFLFQAGRDFMIRTAAGRAGLHVCRMTDAQNEGFGSGPTQVSCGGLRIGIRPYGRATGSAEADSTQSPAVMTLSDGARTRAIRGTIGTAC